MDYYVYSEMESMPVRKLNTESEAIAWTEYQRQQWRYSGSRSIPAYCVQYNPSGKTVKDYPREDI